MLSKVSTADGRFRLSHNVMLAEVNNLELHVHASIQSARGSHLVKGVQVLLGQLDLREHMHFSDARWQALRLLT
jgi:hypothetical protein